MIDGMLTIKEYAEKSGKSVQAVYKQMQSKENAAELEGHVIVRKVGNKPTKLLDEEAVAILMRASSQSPQVIIQTSDKELIAALEHENKAMLLKITELQEKLIDVQPKLALADANQKMLEVKEAIETAQKAQIESQQEKIGQLEAEIAHREEAVRQAEAKLERMKSRSLWARLTNRDE